ncbi:MAG: anaerobic ribonucleoside-triphosphate reductase activating protein [Oscillospiraceae bacterium]|nr:anaerobic ribonucleoside-triphosphate reductase activating protein [Oscillospiraceae bacterium]
MQISAKQVGSACRAEGASAARTPGVIRVSGLTKNSIVDGPGIRFVVFGQGCPLKCPDCHNPSTHDFFGGELMDISDIVAQIESDPLLDGVTFSGGEPFAQAVAFAELAARLPHHHIMCYSGYTFDELYSRSQSKQGDDIRALLSRIDVLVDGRFDSVRKTYDAKFKGSTNQRAIDVKESLQHGKAIEISL